MAKHAGVFAVILLLLVGATTMAAQQDNGNPVPELWAEVMNLSVRIAALEGGGGGGLGAPDFDTGWVNAPPFNDVFVEHNLNVGAEQMLIKPLTVSEDGFVIQNPPLAFDDGTVKVGTGSGGRYRLQIWVHPVDTP